METTKNEMDTYSKNFFLKLGNYLDTQIYYFGSIQRNDYFPGKSDIDVDLFTDNSSSTIIKLQNFLGFEKYKFKKFVYKLHKTQKIVYGHKVKYDDPSNNFFTEMSIYNEKYKDDVLLEHNSKAILPFEAKLLFVTSNVYARLRFNNACVFDRVVFSSINCSGGLIVVPATILIAATDTLLRVLYS